MAIKSPAHPLMLALAALVVLLASPASANEEGAQLYATLCTACHGEAGAGDGPAGQVLDPAPANLASAELRATRSDEDFTAMIRDGGAALGRSPVMPAFGAQLDEAQVASLVSFIRSLPVATAATPAAETPGAGKPKLAASNPFYRTRFHVGGFATVQFEITKDGGPSFTSVQLAPVLLWQLHENVMVEAEFEMGYANGGFDLGLEYAQVDMMPTKYTTITAGLFLLPMGIFLERLHPSWINRGFDFPYPYSGGHHSGAIPMNGLGVQVRGAVPLGQQTSFNYAAFVINGPGDAGGFAEMSGSVPDNNWNKFVGGRVGFLPVRSIEIGVSAMTGLWDDDVESRFSALVGDLMVSAGGFNAQAELITTRLHDLEGDATQRTLWWAQVAYRFDTLPGVLSMFEVTARYGGAALPEPAAGMEGMDHEAIEFRGSSIFVAAAGHDDGGDDAMDMGSAYSVGLTPGVSHQIGGGINFYPLPSLAVRTGVHYTLPTDEFTFGVTLGVGF